MGDHTHLDVQPGAATIGLHAMSDRYGMYGRMYDDKLNGSPHYSNNS